MGFSRSRSRSYSPRRGVGGNRQLPTKTSVLARNLSKATTADDVREVAERYGPIRDVYIPRDFYTREPRGIAFIEYTNARDAEDAVQGLDQKLINGHAISVVYAEHGRKRPETFMAASRGGAYSDRWRLSYDRDRYRGHNRSRSRHRGRDRSRSQDSGRQRGRSRSRDRSQSRNRSRDRSRGHNHSRSRDKGNHLSRSPRSPDRCRDDPPTTVIQDESGKDDMIS